MKDTRRQGMTLLELMIVLAIVALLATLAYPTFAGHFQRARRQDAINTLYRLQLKQEQWRAQDRDYATLTELGWSGRLSIEGYYRLEIRSRTPGGYRIIARPLAPGPQTKDACGAFALNQDGPLLIPGFADARCWRG